MCVTGQPSTCALAIRQAVAATMAAMVAMAVTSTMPIVCLLKFIWKLSSAASTSRVLFRSLSLFTNMNTLWLLMKGNHAIRHYDNTNDDTDDHYDDVYVLFILFFIILTISNAGCTGLSWAGLVACHMSRSRRPRSLFAHSIGWIWVKVMKQFSVSSFSSSFHICIYMWHAFVILVAGAGQKTSTSHTHHPLAESVMCC